MDKWNIEAKTRNPMPGVVLVEDIEKGECQTNLRSGRGCCMWWKWGWNTGVQAPTYCWSRIHVDCTYCTTRYQNVQPTTYSCSQAVSKDRRFWNRFVPFVVRVLYSTRHTSEVWWDPPRVEVWVMNVIFEKRVNFKWRDLCYCVMDYILHTPSTCTPYTLARSLSLL